MKTPLSLACLLLTAGVATLALPSPAAAQNNLVTMYELTELTVGDNVQSRAYAINDTGQIIGWVKSEESKHSAHWHNQVGTDLHGVVHFELKHPLFDQDFSEAFDISNADQAVGTARTLIKCGEEQFVVTHGYVLRPAVLTDLATPYPGDALINLRTLGDPCLTAYDSAAVGISNASHIVGWADREDGVVRAFVVAPVDGQLYLDAVAPAGVNDLMIDLGTLGNSDPVSSATAVNDAGQVTGYSYTKVTTTKDGYHAFLVTPLDNDVDGIADQWFAGANGVNNLMTDLGTLGGTNSWGRDLNNNAQVVGESDVVVSTGENYTHAFLWVNGTMTDLGTLRSDPTQGFSAASGINDKGVIVGWAEDDHRRRRAFVYENGQMKDLNDLLYLYNEDGSIVVPGITLTEARDINEDGVIVGWGEIRGSQGDETRGFLLNPVLVDPSELEDDEDDTTGDPNQPSTSTGTGDFDGAPILGTPEHLLGDLDNTDGQGDDDTTDGTQLTTLCGAGTATMLPLMLAGLCWMKFGQRRR